MRIARAVFRLSIILFVIGNLVSCVTTKTSMFKESDAQEEIERRVEAASTYLDQGNTDQAIFHLKKALEVDDRSAPVHDALARVFVRTGEYELAEEHYRKAISSDADFSRARNNYAALLYQLDRFDEAMVQLERVVADTFYEARPDAFVNLGLCALKLGRVDRAEESFKRALAMNLRGVRGSLALLELAEINFNRGDFAQSKRYYSEFRQLSPSQSPRSLLLGIRLARIFEDKDAEASYALVLKSLYPESKEYLEYRKLQ